jgi:hypothetical protein
MDIGDDGSLCRLRFPQGARGLVCKSIQAFILVQDLLPGRVHGGGSGELGRLLGFTDHSVFAGRSFQVKKTVAIQLVLPFAHKRLSLRI